MDFTPGENPFQLSVWKKPFTNNAFLDKDKGFIVSIFNVKMRRIVLVTVHSDFYSVEKAYLCIRNVNANNIIYMSIEDAIMGGIVFKGKKDKPKEEEKVKTKAKKATYIRGQHGSGAAKMKADIRKKRANRHKK